MSKHTTSETASAGQLNSAHTPGPWDVLEVHQSADVLEWLIGCVRPATDACRENPRIAIVEEMGGSTAGEREGRANAALIASAPDLLAERDSLRAENQALREALAGLTSEIEARCGNMSGAGPADILAARTRQARTVLTRKESK